MSYKVLGWTWSGTIPWIKPAGQPYKGGFKQAAEFITWGVRGGLAKDRLAPVFVPGPRVDTGEAVDVAPSPVGQGHVVRVLLGLDEALARNLPKGPPLLVGVDEILERVGLLHVLEPFGFPCAATPSWSQWTWELAVPFLRTAS
ncbi:hypothetical protein [Streptomyces halstedii]|uniref:hypothetical protein n=1 Tax=Streptomyces halstedii TaxID=1944 RepID=UPI0037F4D245